MARTRAAQPPHIMPLTSSSTVEPAPAPAPAPATSAAAASTALEADDGSAVARVRPAAGPRVGRRGWRRRWEWVVGAARRK
jgi:hypothetical protein